MIALLLAATIGQLPILPPILPNENSKADVATLGYLVVQPWLVFVGTNVG